MVAIMGRHVALIHAPLLGPASWRPVGHELTERGHAVVVPDLRDTLVPPDGWWERAVELATGAAAADGDPDVLIAHSGAGVLLPLLAARAATRTAIFVDAALPARSGATQPAEGLREQLRTLPLTDGRLPPWSTWWGPGVMEELVPDADTRAAIEAEQVRLPLSFYDHSVPVEPGWEPAEVHYLQLSEAYAAEASRAAELGWAVHHDPGLHLDIARRPADIAALLHRLLG